MPPKEQHVRVRRSARYFVVGSAGDATRELWIACHGYGQLAEPFARGLEPLDDGTRVVVAPEALNRFYLDKPAKRHGPETPVGAGWMTFQDRENEITDYVEYLDDVTVTVRREIPGRDIRVVALGFSQGVATVCRWAALGQTRVQQMILWGGLTPHDLPPDRGDQLFRGAALTMVAGRDDHVVPLTLMQKQYRAFVERGLSVEFVEFDGGHALHSETLRRLAVSS